ncbi:NXPE family member 3-like, partial [Diadema antillarum]|uniref:NXPE family member 3-like n=1 Tax=Diadema antillarum TaxID=105358 RepID=UPI003A8A5C4E
LDNVQGHGEVNNNALRISDGDKNVENFEAKRSATREPYIDVPLPFCASDLSNTDRNRFVRQFPRFKPRDWKNDTDATSRLKSDFEIIEKKHQYRVCDRVQVLIRARNGRGEPKKFGGDYFRARLVTNDHKGHVYSSKSDGEVVDNGDGTYMATFTLKWPGDVVIRVYLVHPGEGTYVLRSQRDTHDSRYSYKGTYCSSDGRSTEERECNVYISAKTHHVCKFTDRRTQHQWYCLHPTRESGLDCSNWCKHRSDSRGANAVMLTSMTEKEKSVFKTSADGILHSKDYEIKNVNNASVGSTQPLPPCKPNFHSNGTIVSGYYANDVWVSPYCNILRFSSSLGATRRCLRGKTVFFLGDSTVKKLFDYFMSRLGNLTITHGELFMRADVGPLVAEDKWGEISMVYFTHGYPLGDDVVYDIHDVKYLANIIHDLNVDRDSVIVISIWRHFTPHKTSLYKERIRTILSEVEKLHQRSPLTKVIFNTPNTRDHEKLDTIVYASDYYARDLNEVLREVLAGYPKVGLLDSWDMTNAHLHPHTIHPGAYHLENLSNHLLSYICPHG